MGNHKSLLSLSIIVFAILLFSSSIFSGLVAIPSLSFPLNSALASPTNTGTEDETQSPRTIQEQPQAEPPTEVEPPPPPPPPPPDDDRPPIVADPPTEVEQVPDDQPPPPPPEEPQTTNETTPEPLPPTNDTTTEPLPTNGTAPTNGTTTDGNRSSIINRISVQIEPAICTSVSDAEHWNKIVFRITTDPTGRIPSDLINTELEVLERVNDGGVINLQDIVRYSIVNEPGALPQLTFEEVGLLEIDILDAEYALICFR